MEFSDLPRGLPGSSAASGSAPRSLWMAPRTLQESDFWTYESGKIFLGQTEQGNLIGAADNRHLITIAGSRAGKGTSAIIPNLLLYPGSVLVIDPKGENATMTAERRGQGRNIADGGLGQNVFVVDPFGVADVDDEYRAGFNPLADLDPKEDTFIDECDAIADALVVTEPGKENDHFASAARLILRGYIAWVAAHPDIQDKSLNEVRRLLFLPSMPPEDDASIDIPDVNDQLSYEQLLALMLMDPSFAHGIPHEAAASLASLGDRELGSVLSTIRNNIGFISSPPMARTLAGGTRAPDLKAWKNGSSSVYLCLPAGRLHRHFRFFRLFINRLMNALESNRDVPEVPAIMILDEMHVLGHMKSLETAAGLVAGFGVRIWSIWQDLAQLKHLYQARWETFLGNASIFQIFGLNDLTTLKYVSDRLGTSSVMQINNSEISQSQAAGGFTGQSRTIQAAPLLSADEVAYFFSRQSNNQLIIYPGADPIMIRRLPFFDERFDNMREKP